MIRTLSFLALAVALALPAQALSIDLSLPSLRFPDPVTTPSTKGCDAVRDTAACPRGQ